MTIQQLQKRVLASIRDIPDFPKPGVLFKDITPVLADPGLCRDIVDALLEPFSEKKIDAIVGIESRGFIFGMMMANKLNVPFLLVRKAGKLPGETISSSYDLEYGSAIIEMHKDSIKAGWKVLIHDDLLATGGTAAAAAKLVEVQGGEIEGFQFLIELEFLGGRKKLESFSKKIVSLVSY
jgi:adenine phosphoribosyltransferase